MRKRPIFILALSCLLLAACGAPQAVPSGPPPAHDPNSAKQAETLELGKVRIYPRTGGWQDSGRDQAVLDLVAKKLKTDRNIAMDLEVFYTDSAMDAGPDAALAAMLAAGSGPEIVIYRFMGEADQFAAQQMPAALDDALKQYGPNLMGSDLPGTETAGLVPEECWQATRVGGATLAIPAWANNREGLVANSVELSALGATVPTTIDDMEALLAKAQAQGVKFLCEGTEDELADWYGLAKPTVLRSSNGELHSVYTLPQYADYLNRLLNWRANGWFKLRDPNLNYSSPPPSKPTDPWLFRSSTLLPESLSPYIQRYFQNAVAVPPILLGGQGAFYGDAYSVQRYFMSYKRPEALVSLLDWLLSDTANETLLTWGEKGTDYTQDANGQREVAGIHYNDNMQAWAFNFSGLFGTDWDRGTPKEYIAAVAQLEQNAQDIAAPSAVPRLTQMAPLYARPGSRLETAYDAMTAYIDAMNTAVAQVLNGQMTVADFQAKATEGEKGIQDYKELIAGIQGGTYNPAEDMYQPARP